MARTCFPDELVHHINHITADIVNDTNEKLLKSNHQSESGEKLHYQTYTSRMETKAKAEPNPKQLTVNDGKRSASLIPATEAGHDLKYLKDGVYETNEDTVSLESANGNCNHVCYPFF